MIGEEGDAFDLPACSDEAHGERIRVEIRHEFPGNAERSEIAEANAREFAAVQAAADESEQHDTID